MDKATVDELAHNLADLAVRVYATKDALVQKGVISDHDYEEAVDRINAGNDLYDRVLEGIIEGIHLRRTTEP